MKTYYKQGFVFFVFLLVSGCGKPEGYHERVSIYGAVGDPKRFSEARIAVKGYLIVDGEWRLFTDPIRSKTYDLYSAIYVGSYPLIPLTCNDTWVTIKGKTKRNIGGELEFDPLQIDYITKDDPTGKLTTPEYCYQSEAFRKNKNGGKVTMVPAETSTPVEVAE